MWKRLFDTNTLQVSMMIHTKLRLIMKTRLRDFSVSVFHFTMFLLLLTNSSRGQSQMIGSSQPTMAMVDDDIILPCYLEPAVDARDLTVEWTRPDLDPEIIHAMRDGKELLDDKNPSYKERTSLSTDKLKRGDVSLKLSKVKLSDAGTYRCLVPTSDTEHVVELAVGSVSPPEIKISKDSIGVLLQCESKGWYPKPQVLWLDGEGNLLSAGPAEPIRGPDGLYTVSSRVTVEKKHSKSFTCRVQQKNINQTRETHVHVTDELFMVQSNSALRIAISLTVSFLCIVVILLVVCKMRQNKTKTKDSINKLQRLIWEEKERLSQIIKSEKLNNFEKKKENLDEELQKNKEEVEKVQHVITTLKDLRTDLKDQRDILNQLPQRDKTIKEKMEKMLGEFGFFHSDKIRDQVRKTKDELEQKMTEHVELIQNTDKLLDNKEKMIIKMTKMMEKLERDKEQINTQLKETRRQREEVQMNLQSEQQEREEKRNDPSPDDSA